MSDKQITVRRFQKIADTHQSVQVRRILSAYICPETALPEFLNTDAKKARHGFPAIHYHLLAPMILSSDFLKITDDDVEYNFQNNPQNHPRLEELSATTLWTHGPSLSYSLYCMIPQLLDAANIRRSTDPGIIVMRTEHESNVLARKEHLTRMSQDFTEEQRDQAQIFSEQLTHSWDKLVRLCRN